jgi:hypothetical protein
VNVTDFLLLLGKFNTTCTILAANAGPDKSICNGTNVKIGDSLTATQGNPPYTYSWSPGAGLNSTASANPLASPTSTTTYTVTVTDSKACSATSIVTVKVNPNPTASAGQMKAVCPGKGAIIGDSLVASGGTSPYSYSWSPTSGLSSSTIANPTASPTITTIYTVTVTDMNGCMASSSTSVKLNPQPSANGGTDKVICYKSSTEIGATPAGTGGLPPYSYSWNPSAGLNSSLDPNPVASPPATTFYTLTVTDANGCSASTQPITVKVNPTPTANAGIDKTICDGAHTTIGDSLTASGGTTPYTYSWNPSTGLSSASIANPSASPVSTTIYTVTVTDMNGCSSSASVNVKVNANPLASAGADKAVCYGSNTVIGNNPTASGGAAPYTYSWKPSTGLNSTTVSNPLAGPITASVYTVTVTDGNGCSASSSVSVKVNALPVPVITAGGPTTFYHLDSVTLIASPVKGYTYLWSNARTDQTIKVFVSGNYRVTVTDSNGCVGTSNTITVKVLPRPYILTNTLNTCVPNTFCLPVTAVDTVRNVIGYDMVLHFDKSRAKPTGNISIANVLINPAWVGYSTGIDSVKGLVNISVYFNSAAPANAFFSGNGTLLCVEFNKTNGFAPIDTSRFTISQLSESYYSNVKPKLVDPGYYSTYKDSIFHGKLVYWSGNLPIKSGDGKYLDTRIYGGACNNQSGHLTSVDSLGNFSYTTTNGLSINIERDILNTTKVGVMDGGFLSGNDALKASQIIFGSQSFKPNIYQMIAADVNLDGYVSAGDISQINQRIVATIPEFKQKWNYDGSGNSIPGKGPSKDWLFADSTFVSATFSKSNVPQVPFCIPVSVFNYNTCPIIKNETYTGILLGDVDGSYSKDGNEQTMRLISDGQVTFDLSHAQIKENYVDVPVSVSAPNSVGSLDFALKYNESNLTYNSVVPEPNSDMDALVDYNIADHTLRFTSSSLKNFENEKILLNLRFSTKANNIEPNDLNILSGYLNGNRVKTLLLETSTGIGFLNNEGNIRVYPNPVSNLLNVVISENANIQLLTVDGRLIFQTKVNANQRQEINTEDLADGVYLLKVSTNVYTSDRKVIISR